MATQSNVWQVPASILLAPVVTLTLLTGVAKIALTPLIPSLAPRLADVTAWCSGSMRWTVGQLARLPAADVPLPSPPIWLAALCWMTLALAVVPWKYPSARILTILACIASYVALLAGPYANPPASVRPGTGELRMTLLAVGAGQTALVEPPGGKVSLFDVGSTSLTDLTGNVVAPALRAFGHTSIDTITLSHANLDHYSGASDVTASYGVSNVLVGPGFEALARQSGTGEQLLRELRQAERPPRVVHVGDSVPLGSQTTIDVLSPPTGDAPFVDNDGSLVLRLTHAGTRILFTGDIQDVAMRELLKHPEQLQADVLIAPHHGSLETTTQQFIEAVHPKLILASNDRTLTGKQRDFDALCAKRGWKLLRTHTSGAISIRIESDGTWTVEPFVKK
ncbi:MAG: ComEC/Rec2 family competence protein [Tepidisphaeraceae bacterium]